MLGGQVTQPKLPQQKYFRLEGLTIESYFLTAVDSGNSTPGY